MEIYMNTNIQRFLRESGLKVLAVSRMNSCEYSVVMYLLNAAMTGLENLITTENELGSIIGHSPREVRQAIEELEARHIIKSRYGDGSQAPKFQSLSLGIQWDLSRWKLGLKEVPTHHEAVILPFRRGFPKLSVVEGKRHEDHSDKPVIHKAHSDEDTTQRIIDAFSRGRELDEHERKINKQVAEALGAAHPVDQILVMIRHFDHRIPTLSLLASNWDHYVEQYEHEHQKLDLFGQRQKQHELDQKVREAAAHTLERREQLDLSEEELQVLDLLANHRHPRRQLFWAYQMRIRYPKLTGFFTETHSLMLPITQSGTVVKRPTE
jgi:DNA-binding Lrp family transcriptional regulator